MAEATAVYTSCLSCPKEPPLFASAEALVSDTYETSGPVRYWFMKLDVTVYSLHGNPVSGDY